MVAAFINVKLKHKIVQSDRVMKILMLVVSVETENIA